MERVNDVWEAEGRPRIHLRIGLNCANVLVGNVGSSNRLSYTALGDGVNVAARLEGINKLFGTTICISDSIYDQAKADILARPLKRVQVKGRKTEFMIYELLALRTSDDPELKVRDRDEQLSAMTWQASQKFEAGDFPAAERAYRDILKEFPEDSLARFMIAECAGKQRSDLADVPPASRGGAEENEPREFGPPLSGERNEWQSVNRRSHALPQPLIHHPTDFRKDGFELFWGR